jgi:hypothetical protein
MGFQLPNGLIQELDYDQAPQVDAFSANANGSNQYAAMTHQIRVSYTANGRNTATAPPLFGQIGMLDSCTNVMAVSSLWVHNRDLYGERDGIPKCLVKEVNSNIHTVGKNQNVRKLLTFEIAYKAFDRATGKLTTVKHVVKDVVVTDNMDTETPLLFDNNFLKEFDGHFHARDGTMDIVTPVTKRHLTLQWREHPATGLWYIPIDSIQLPTCTSQEEVNSRRWTPVAQGPVVKPKPPSRPAQQGLATSNRFDALTRAEGND